jgi:hypothetical protein
VSYSDYFCRDIEIQLKKIFLCRAKYTVRIMTDDFSGFPQSLQINSGLLPYNYSQLFPFTYICQFIFTDRCYMKYDIDKALLNNTRINHNVILRPSNAFVF